MSYRIICDLCRADFPADAPFATLSIPERGVKLSTFDEWMGRRAVRELHICVACVDRLLVLAREHARALAGHTYGVPR